MRFLAVLAYTILFVHFFTAATHAQERHALLIGNQKYSPAVGILKNPTHDIRLIANALHDIGFKQGNVRLIENADRITMLDEIDSYGERLRKAGAGAIGFFYYSGHGAAREGERNYLLPVGVKKLDRRLWHKSVSLDNITHSLRNQAPEAVHFVIFDACRNLLNLPVKGTKGFKAIPETQGMVIAFSSAPGRTASDLGDSGGPYARVLASELRRRGVHHLDLFQNVKEAVYKQTGDQIPWERNGLLKRVYLAGLPKAPSPQHKKLIKPTIGVFNSPFQHGYKFDDCNGADWCPKMIVVRGGTFTMGSEESEVDSSSVERPRHQVSIRKFSVGRFEISKKQYHIFVQKTGHDFGAACDIWNNPDLKFERISNRTYQNPGYPQQDNHPAACINWHDAKAYVSWLSRQTGKTYRLLTEAEWEYVASAKRPTPFWWGKSISTSQANYDGNDTYGGGSIGLFRKKTVPVNNFSPNPFGLYNVHGNVSEWVEDCWHKNYTNAPQNGAAWLDSNGGRCSKRVFRGGSWNSYPASLRSRVRGRPNSHVRREDIGFRVARDL